jgi:hypothetical protein
MCPKEVGQTTPKNLKTHRKNLQLFCKFGHNKRTGKYNIPEAALQI